MAAANALLRQQLRRVPGLRTAYRRVARRRYILRDWWSTTVWRAATTVTVAEGFTLRAGSNPASDQMRDGTFEQDEVALLKALLPEVDLFVDVGANIGYFTCLALHLGRDVVAFEPQPQNLQHLLRNIADNGWAARTQVFPVALSGQAGVMPLFGASGPCASLLPGWGGYSPAYRQLVPVATLDQLASPIVSGRRAFIKVDVEGAEHFVLSGADALVRSTPRPLWLVEICLDEHHPTGPNPHYFDVFDLFWSNGYEARTATADRRLVTRDDVRGWVAQGHSESGTSNYLFAEPGRLM